MVLDLETSYITTVDQTMLARRKEDFLSVEFDMMEADSLLKLGNCWQEVEMQIELERVRPCLLPLKRFKDVDARTCSYKCVVESLLTIPPLPLTASQKSSKSERRGPYRCYTVIKLKDYFT